jgi:A/G-specific adenine glycosylase
VAILDGNVKRVLTRVLGFDGDLAEAAAERELWAEATALLPQRGIEPYTQGLMDLGATLCLARSPSCLLCPVQGLCSAAREGTQASYPIKTRKLKRSAREHVWLWLAWRDRVWLVQRPERGVWAGLWSLAEFDDTEAFDTATSAWPGDAEALPSFTHVLTHLDWRLHPVRWTLPARTSPARRAALTSPWPTGRWFSLDEALAAGLPAPLRKLLSA